MAGIALHFLVDTYEDLDPSAEPIHCAVCKIKVFRDKVCMCVCVCVRGWNPEILSDQLQTVHRSHSHTHFFIDLMLLYLNLSSSLFSCHTPHL